MMKIYFLPGICVNCKVFDKITLPEGYEKAYIEWLPPEGQSLEKYVRRMAESIDTSQPFALVGYSMGGVILQEMNCFLKPEKNILISSMKRKSEIPPLIRITKKTHINEHIPKFVYGSKQASHWIAQLMLAMKPAEIEEFVTFTSSEYLQWAIHHITEWEPKIECPNLYHIHGTKDQIFPFRQIKDAYVVENGDHMMVYRKAEEVSWIIKKLFCDDRV